MGLEYTASGGAKTGGCAIAQIAAVYISTDFQPNDNAYVWDSAVKGRIEKVVVKEVLVTHSALTWNRYLVKYKDTFNRLYIEGDLVDEFNALLLVEAFLTSRQAALC